jgi:isopentenyl phosphate kinase
MIFLKLGGSLITDKDRPETARPHVVRRLAEEIAGAREENPDLVILLGHGSGSFGHSVATRYGTHLGASAPAQWQGLAEVWAAANRLNRLVVDALRQAGLPALSMPPSASAVCEGGELVSLAIEPIERALRGGLMPVVAGDVAFDRVQGTTIVSTERVFSYLAPAFRPTRLLLAGIEPGVFSDFPVNTRRIDVLTQNDLAAVRLSSSTSADVTGGMADKVDHALRLVQTIPGLEALIFSAQEPGQLRAALLGETPGTRVVHDPTR